MRSENLRKLIWSTIVVTLLWNQVQAQFGDPLLISDSPYLIEGLCFDVDVDGDDDVVWGESRDGSIYWKENLGDGVWSEDQLIGNEWVYYIEMATADLDNDGDTDLIVWDKYKTISWYENLGQGAFSFSYLSPEEGLIHNIVHPADIDNDGDMDILSAWGDAFYWLENLGGGTFSPAAVLIESTNTNTTLLTYTVLDVDGDDDLDIVASIYGGGFGYYLNNGDLTFEPFFMLNEDVEVGTSQFWHRVLRVYDVDGDGLNDLLYGSRHTVWLFMNLTDGNLDTGTVVRSFENEQYFSRQPDIQIGNFDDDENVDLIIASNLDYSSSTFIDPAPALHQYEWDGTEFVFIEEEIIEVMAVESIEMIDVDGDEDLDIFAFSTRDDAIGYFPLENGEVDVNFVELTEGLGGVRFSYAADIDQDFDLDIITASSGSGKVAWYERLDDGSFADQELILENEIGITFFTVKDIDLDGDEDLVIQESVQGSHYWLENDGTGSFEMGGSIPGLFGGSGFEAFFEDFDEDGDLDALSFREEVNGIRVLKGNGPGTFSFSGNSYGVNEVGTILNMAVGDIDNDLDLDAVAFIEDEDGNFAVGYFQNDGQAEFDEFVVIDFLGVDPSNYQTEVADVDLDGNIDIVTRSTLSAFEPAVFHLLRNEGGGEFSDPEIILDEIGRVAHFELADLDLNGSPDVLLSRVPFAINSTTGLISPPINDYIHVLYNSGAGEFSDPVPLYTAGKFFNTFSVVDFDSDSDPDLLLSSVRMSEVYLVPNEKFSPVQVSGEIFIDANQNGVRDPDEETPSWLEIASDPPAANYFVSDTGHYFLSYGNFEEDYTISPAIPPFFEISTPFEEYTFSIGADFTGLDTLDFGISIPDGFDGLNLNLVGGMPRCNQTVPYWINIFNEGLPLENGIIELELDELVSFNYSDLEPDSIVGQKVFWSLSSLSTFEDTLIMSYVDMPDFQSLGETIVSSVEISLLDEDGEVSFSLADQLVQTIVCAYDPNDKQVFPDTGTIGLGQELEYLIRFQNTGNDTAFTVIIEDNLSHYLDWETVDYITSGHDLTNYTIDDDGRLLFNFLDIQLPDSNADYLGSQGFVLFRIKALDDLMPNTTIENTAGIYFDFNPAIITNTVNSVVECYIAPDPVVTFEYPYLTAGVTDGVDYQWFLNGAPIFGGTESVFTPMQNGFYSVEVTDVNGCTSLSSEYFFQFLSTRAVEEYQLSIYPNPSSGNVNFHFDKNSQHNHSLKIFDSTGRLIFQEFYISEEVYILPEGSLSNGFYTVLVTDGQSENVATGKIVIVGN